MREVRITRRDAERIHLSAIFTSKNFPPVDRLSLARNKKDRRSFYLPLSVHYKKENGQTICVARRKIEKLLAYRCRPVGNCLEWMSSVDRCGYAQTSFGIHGNVIVSRLVWLFYRGSLTPGKFICHHCDNRRCVKIDHLFEGTAKDNFDDMVKKGRDRLFGRPKKASCYKYPPGFERIPLLSEGRLSGLASENTPLNCEVEALESNLAPCSQAPKAVSCVLPNNLTHKTYISTVQKGLTNVQEVDPHENPKRTPPALVFGEPHQPQRRGHTKCQDAASLDHSQEAIAPGISRTEPHPGFLGGFVSGDAEAAL